ncbi:UNVERIFIED_CONTAM: hypothetical protein Scaly_2200100 [Sesamum calycinum]|uniref:Retrovirus-related Pol polyprotein from transposon TNT 1-94-like beta-barrel domain-containing protein n=1 Tax=Sesamum calycinum TaxID=2727403 RepID=A0AAW2MPH4_9LAMI
MIVGGSSGASTSGTTEGYVSVQSEVLTIYEPYDWLIDTGMSARLPDKSLFLSYQAISGRTVRMENASTAEVLGIGSVDLKFSSWHILSLKRVHHEYLQVFHLMIHLSTSISEHVEKMSNVGVNLSSTSLTHKESDEPRRSKRAKVDKNFGSDFVTYNIEDDPVTFKDVMASSEAKKLSKVR